MAVSLPFHSIKKKLLKNYYKVVWEDRISIFPQSSIEDSTHFKSLCMILKEDFALYCRYDILTGKIIDAAKSEFNKHGIFFNESVNNGFVLIRSDRIRDETVYEIGGCAVVAARGYAKVNLTDRAKGYAYNHTVLRVYCSSSLMAYDHANISAFGNSSVYAYDHCSIRADSCSFLTAHDNCNVRSMGYSRVDARGKAKVVCMFRSVVSATDNVYIEAQGMSYVYIWNKVSFRLKEKAILHDKESNTIYYADKNMEFKNVKSMDVDLPLNS